MGLREAIYREGSPLGFAARARARRWSTFRTCFPDLASMTVLDLGGRVEFWRGREPQPRHLVVVTLESGLVDEATPDIEVVVGDACELPQVIRDREFDLVHSNSLIEHVGGYQRRRKLAESIRTVAPSYWVQTPYRYFPIELHWLFPFAQFFPLRWRAMITRTWPFGPRAGTADDATALAADIELLSITEMRHLFPDGRLIREQVGPVTKSLVYVRGAVDGVTRT